MYPLLSAVPLACLGLSRNGLGPFVPSHPAASCCRPSGSQGRHGGGRAQDRQPRARPVESRLVVLCYAAPGGYCCTSLFLISKEPLTVAPQAGLGCSLTAESVRQVCLSACWSTPEGRGKRAPRWRDGESPTCSGAHPRGWVEPTRAGHQVRSPAGAWLCPSEALAPTPSSSWTNQSWCLPSCCGPVVPDGRKPGCSGAAWVVGVAE